MGSRFDWENQVCRAQAFTGGAEVSDYAYEKQTAAQDISIGRMYGMLVMATVDAGAGSSHVLEVVQADDASLTTNVESLVSKTVAAANLTTDYDDRVVLPIPQGSMSRKYIGLRNTITGGVTTVTLDAYLMPLDEIEWWKPFPKQVTPSL